MKLSYSQLNKLKSEIDNGMMQSGKILADLDATIPQVKAFKKAAPDIFPNIMLIKEYYINILQEKYIK